MNERAYVGNEPDCRLLCDTLDLIYGVPYPGVYASGPNQGQSICTPQEQTLKTNQWFALSKAQRDSKTFDSAWVGWTLRATEVTREPSPGARFAVWLPENITTVQQLLDLAALRSVVLSLQQILNLTAAVTASLIALPQDWAVDAS